MRKATSCALDFWDKNYDECMKVQAAVIAAGKKFLSGTAKDVLPEPVVTAARTALDRSDVVQLAQVLRPQAAQFSAFFCDATTSLWTYITVQQRKQSLLFSLEEAAQV